MPSIVGPTTLTVGAANPVPDPSQRGGNPSVAVQIQNSSPYQLTVIAAGDSLSIQPFFAQTVEITGAPITVTPLAGASSQPCSVTFAFLIGAPPGDGVQLPSGTWAETPPQQDGPLTAAAIASALSVQGSVDLVAQATYNSPVTPIGGVAGSFVAAKSYRALICVVVTTTPQPVSFIASDQNDTFVNFSAPFGSWAPISGGFMALCPFANSVGDTVDFEFYFNPASTANGSYAVYGLTNPPDTLCRADGRAYPIGFNAQHAFSAGAGTTTVVAAPASPLRILLNSLSFESTGVGTAVVATINGISRNLIQLGAAGSLALPIPEKGLLLDPATALTIAGAAGINCGAFVTYDVVA